MTNEKPGTVCWPRTGKEHGQTVRERARLWECLGAEHLVVMDEQGLCTNRAGLESSHGIKQSKQSLS